MSTTRQMSLTDWSLIGALSVIWGGAFFFIEIILREVPPNSMVLLRLSLAIPPLLFWLHWRGERLPRDWLNWRNFFIIGALNVALPFALFAYGQTHISSGLASVLNATTPLWGVLVAHFLTVDEKATLGRIVGVIIGFAGVAVMIGGGGLSLSGHGFWAQIACIVATLFYGFAAIAARRMGDGGLSPMQIATGQVIAASVLLIPLVLLTETPWNGPVPTWPTWAAALGLSVLSTSLAYALYFRLIASAGASNALLITFLIPVTAILLGSLFFAEVMTSRQMGGMILIALGLAALDGRAFRLFARNK